MNRITAFFAGLLMVFAIGRAGHLVLARSNPNAATPACGSISTNTTWSLPNSPYDVCASGVTVAAGATLTVDPGVTVQFEAGAANKLNVVGSLQASGTAAQPVTFTGVSAAAGSWGGISVAGSAGAKALLSLDFATLDYGGIKGSFGAEVYADQATIAIKHSLIENSAGNGVYISPTAAYSLQSTNFVGNGLNAVQVNSPNTDLLLSELSASGNGANGVRLAGSNTSMPGQRRWAWAGIPYFIDVNIGNSPGDELTIDPGNQLIFSTNVTLNIGGELKALGTADQPILMTGANAAPGAWVGIFVDGGSQTASAELDYVTLEYAGSNAAGIELMNGQLSAHHSIIRNSSKDGVRFDSKAGGSILDSQVYGNSLYGVRNGTPALSVLATNDYWGNAGGPQSDVVGCSTGLGDRVTAGVMFIPFAAAPGQMQAFPLSSAPNLTLTPRRWFAPADGVSHIYFDITLRDGNGSPIPGRTVNLTSTLGTVVDGGVTDALGKTLAYITSTTTGDANVSAMLNGLTACEGVLSPNAKVTFTTPVAQVDLMPDSASPYTNSDISVSPMPVVTGVNTTLSALLTNPLTTPVTVDVSFGFAQSGIGLVFGPIKDYVGQVIPGGRSITLTAAFVPVVSGHYCVQVSYAITALGPQPVLAPQAAQQLKQFNLNVQQSTTSSNDKDNSLQKTRTSLKRVNQFVDRTYSPNPFAVPLFVANQGIAWDLNNAEKISNALQGDPPRQDYTIIDSPHVLALPPIQPGNGITPARAAALNTLDSVLAQANAYGTAAATAFDRSGGAAEASALNWVSTQTAAMLEYNQLFGQALITAAQAIDSDISEAASEGVTSLVIPVSDVIAMQQKLTASGFSAQEIADAHAVGLTDADIAAILQNILAAAPEDLAGDVIANLHQISAQFYLLGGILSNPSFFNPGLIVTGAPQGQPQAAGNRMAQVYDTTTTLQIANPTGASALIDLSARRIDLPADWSVEVSPAQISLAPGQQITVTVSILAGSPVAQGSRPRVAVEGYIGTQMIGGVTVDITVPLYQPFYYLHLFLPEMSR